MQLGQELLGLFSDTAGAAPLRKISIPLSALPSEIRPLVVSLQRSTDRASPIKAISAIAPPLLASVKSRTAAPAPFAAQRPITIAPNTSPFRNADFIMFTPMMPKKRAH
jgi:hypothetical protein